MARTYGKAQDLIDFTRASSGTALRRVKYGAELVTNGTFDSDISGWSDLVGTSTYSSGTLQFTSSAGGQGAYQAFPTVAGKVYRAEASSTSASISHLMRVHDTDAPSSGVVLESATAQTTSSTFVVVFVAESSTSNIYLRSGQAGVVNWDNISVKEVTFDTSDGDLVLFNHPNNIPRIEYDANGNLLGLLVEESRSNILPYSQAFDAVDWFKTRGDVASESISDPFGGQGAFSWTANEFSETYIADGATISSGATITFSAFIKKKTADHCHLLVWDNSANGCRVWFDLVNGQVGTDTSFGSTFVVAGSSITESANGWYRCSMTVTTSGSTTAVVRLHPSNGNGDINSSVGKSIYIYGAQLEAGSFPTSYIPTSGSTVTRSADVASLSTSAFGYNDEAGTVVFEGTASQVGDPASSQVFVEIGTSNRSDIYLLSRLAGTSESRLLVNDGVTQADLRSTDFVGGVSGKMAGSWKVNDFAISTDGGAVQTDTSGNLPENVTIMGIGTLANLTGNYLNGHIKSVKYYPRRLTNDQLVELTS